MADSEDNPGAPGGTATADLESKEIWGDEVEQLDEEITKVCMHSDFGRVRHVCVQQ